MQELNAAELKQKLSRNEDLVILDVRNEYEHQMSNIPGNILIPLDKLGDRLSELEQYKNSEIIIYCKSGVRSYMACNILESNGFRNVSNLSDGIIGWLNA